MPDNVLIAFDGSPLSERALTYAIENFAEATLTTIYVINPIDSVIDVEAGGLPVAEDWYDNARDRATRIHTTATDLAGEHNLELNTVTEVGRPARGILEYAADHGIDQIVMGSHGRSGIDRTLLGSVAETVTRRARIPVTIIG
ncbi:universal stress protein [Halorubrum sp. CBA1229]|jgi:nucleotide-binding universal stress UspA family protein|uniref:universal stress protein n=1 Tax=Halorubrum sp. CBA1229 TaxID=1853699 RepID=UPI000F3AAB86|nr:universal stress protein [Halorubrum sp. CBA1229]QKY18599.1 universal stress protein [Halorubrum sp. CBA1229]